MFLITAAIIMPFFMFSVATADAQGLTMEDISRYNKEIIVQKRKGIRN